MKPIYMIYCLAFVIVVTGCGNKEGAPKVASPHVIDAQKKADEAIRQLDAEKQKTAELKKAIKEAEDANQKSQTIAIGLGVAVLIALFIGIGMGSSGRRAAASAKKAADE